MIARGGQQAELAAVVQGEVAPRRCRVRLSRSAARELSVDGKRPRTRASYLSALQTVLFHPGDLQLTTGAPELRRALLDRVLERFDATYAATLSVYERALRSRNRLLRAEGQDRRAITAYHEVLASAGTVIGQAREALVAEFSPRVTEAFAAISGEPVAACVALRAARDAGVERVAGGAGGELGEGLVAWVHGRRAACRRAGLLARWCAGQALWVTGAAPRDRARAQGRASCTS